MTKEDAKIGTKVKTKVHPQKTLYVVENHNPLCAGVAYKKDEKQHVYGVLYSALELVTKKS